MSMQNVISFANAVETDAAMQQEYKSAIGGATGQDGYAKAAQFATAKGYDVTADDVEQGYQALQKSDSGNGELNDAELEMVSGGKGQKEGQQAQQAVGNAVNQGAQGIQTAGNFIRGFFRF